MQHSLQPATQQQDKLQQKKIAWQYSLLATCNAKRNVASCYWLPFQKRKIIVQKYTFDQYLHDRLCKVTCTPFREVCLDHCWFRWCCFLIRVIIVTCIAGLLRQLETQQTRQHQINYSENWARRLRQTVSSQPFWWAQHLGAQGVATTTTAVRRLLEKEQSSKHAERSWMGPMSHKTLQRSMVAF